MSVLSEIGAWFAGLLAAIGIGNSDPANTYHGYVEGEYVRLATPLAGRLERLHVARGDKVDAGAPLFMLDLTEAQAERDRAVAARNQARAHLDDLRKGKRVPELDVIAAQKEQAEAALRLAEVQLRRAETLHASGNTARERVDEARSTYARDRARVAELAAQLEVGRLAAREDDIRAAEAAVAVAEAAVVKAEQQLADLAPKAPQAALVEETYYRQGEWVQAGAPVVSLLPPGNVKIRFYVPEAQLGAVAIGQTVRVRCDGCLSDLSARISFIAPAAEYTPPVIYSNESRAKLVYRLEARPEAPARLHPGQPVDVVFVP
ncbi:MAG TPA: HlyD family efflux transporter periplasmic adaptor subunit [Alphaproteobacteria bacterium]|nr:HlyD family efflux transporter periplasmic adaptor subunit [Alphaproteobacteria bacterium]